MAVPNIFTVIDTMGSGSSTMSVSRTSSENMRDRLTTAVMIASPIVNGLLGLWQTFVNNVVGQRVMQDLRNALYAHLQRLPVSFHDQSQSGQLLSRAMTDLSIMRRFIGFGAIFFVLILVQVAAIFGVLLSLHVPLALLTFAATIPILVLCHKFERRYMVVVRRILVNRIYEGQGFRRTTRDRTLTLRVPAPEASVLAPEGPPIDAITVLERGTTVNVA